MKTGMSQIEPPDVVLSSLDGFVVPLFKIIVEISAFP